MGVCLTAIIVMYVASRWSGPDFESRTATD